MTIKLNREELDVILNDYLGNAGFDLSNKEVSVAVSLGGCTIDITPAVTQSVMTFDESPTKHEPEVEESDFQ